MPIGEDVKNVVYTTEEATADNKMYYDVSLTKKMSSHSLWIMILYVINPEIKKIKEFQIKKNGTNFLNNNYGNNAKN